MKQTLLGAQLGLRSQAWGMGCGRAREARHALARSDVKWP